MTVPRIENEVERQGGLVCKQHPTKPFPHDDCEGPGMTREDAERALCTCADMDGFADCPVHI